jgi:hypothetical protein
MVDFLGRGGPGYPPTLKRILGPGGGGGGLSPQSLRQAVTQFKTPGVTVLQNTRLTNPGITSVPFNQMQFPGPVSLIHGGPQETVPIGKVVDPLGTDLVGAPGADPEQKTQGFINFDPGVSMGQGVVGMTNSLKTQGYRASVVPRSNEGEKDTIFFHTSVADLKSGKLPTINIEIPGQGMGRTDFVTSLTYQTVGDIYSGDDRKFLHVQIPAPDFRSSLEIAHIMHDARAGSTGKSILLDGRSLAQVATMGQSHKDEALKAFIYSATLGHDFSLLHPVSTNLDVLRSLKNLPPLGDDAKVLDLLTANNDRLKTAINMIKDMPAVHGDVALPLVKAAAVMNTSLVGEESPHFGLAHLGSPLMTDALDQFFSNFPDLQFDPKDVTTAKLKFGVSFTHNQKDALNSAQRFNKSHTRPGVKLTRTQRKGDPASMFQAGRRRRGKSKTQRLYHGTLAASQVQEQGFTKGESWELHIPGTSASYAPDVSTTSFGRGDALSNVLIVELPAVTQAQIINLKPSDYGGFDQEMLRELDPIGYGKSQSYHHESEIFFTTGGRKEVVIRRPTDEELRIIQQITEQSEEEYERILGAVEGLGPNSFISAIDRALSYKTNQPTGTAKFFANDPGALNGTPSKVFHALNAANRTPSGASRSRLWKVIHSNLAGPEIKKIVDGSHENAVASSLWPEQYRSALQGLYHISDRVSRDWNAIRQGVEELKELRNIQGIRPGDYEWETKAAEIDESFRNYVQWREFLYKATEVAQLQTSKIRDISVLNSVVRVLKKADFAGKNIRDSLFGLSVQDQIDFEAAMTGPGIGSGPPDWRAARPQDQIGSGGGNLALRELIANHLQQKTFPIPSASGSRSRVGSKSVFRAIMKVLTDGGFSGPN